MLQDGIELVEGSKAKNLVVASGTSFPSQPDEGELFYHETDDALCIYRNGQWAKLQLDGGAAIAEKLATARTITLTGDVQGSVSFDGSANVSMQTAIKETQQSLTFNGPTTVNYANGTYVAAAVTGATTLTITGVPDSTYVYCLILELTNAGTNITWPASVVWLGTALTLRASGISMVTLVTRNGGTTWYGSAA